MTISPEGFFQTCKVSASISTQKPQNSCFGLPRISFLMTIRTGTLHFDQKLLSIMSVKVVMMIML